MLYVKMKRMEDKMNEINNYPKWIDLYFKDNNIVIYRLPDSLRLIDKQALQNKTIKTINENIKSKTLLKKFLYNFIICSQQFCQQVL